MAQESQQKSAHIWVTADALASAMNESPSHCVNVQALRLLRIITTQQGFNIFHKSVSY